MKTKQWWLGVGLAMASITAHSASAGSVVDLGWISGHWCGGDASSRTEESWLPASGDQLLGVSRVSKHGRVTSFEFLRIDSIDGIATYLAQPGGKPPTAFQRTAGGVNWVRFESPAHDFPQRIEYRRDGEHLHAEIAGPGEGGRELVIPFEMRRCPG